MIHWKCGCSVGEYAVFLDGDLQRFLHRRGHLHRHGHRNWGHPGLGEEKAGARLKEDKKMKENESIRQDLTFKKMWNWRIPKRCLQRQIDERLKHNFDVFLLSFLLYVFIASVVLSFVVLWFFFHTFVAIPCL